MWLKEGKLPSHIEGFLFAVQEQEIDTEALRQQRERHQNVKGSMPRANAGCVAKQRKIYTMW